MYIAPKSTNESRVHYTPESVRGDICARLICYLFYLCNY